MIKYFHIIKFLMTHDLNFLKECWEIEFIKSEFSWIKLIKKIRKMENTYIAWWRLCNEMSKYGNKKQKKLANKINRRLTKEYSVEIGIERTFIDKGLLICHYSSIILYDNIKIGKNFTIRQNTTIGSTGKLKDSFFVIGDNVNIGASTTIVSDNLKIGNNVTIGAMSFINKDIPDNCTVYTEKSNIIKIKAH